MGGLDHPGTEIRRILRVAGHSCVALVALPACLAAEQKFNEPAAQGGLRRSLAHRRCADAGPRNSTLAGEAAERIGESRVLASIVEQQTKERNVARWVITLSPYSTN